MFGSRHIEGKGICSLVTSAVGLHGCLLLSSLVLRRIVLSAVPRRGSLAPSSPTKGQEYLLQERGQQEKQLFREQ